MKVLLCVTGSVASILTPRLVDALLSISQKKIEVRIAASERSFGFWNPADVSVEVFRDADEWKDQFFSDEKPADGYRQLVKKPVLHIELRKWADVLLIAPLTANTLAKMANGLCDNLITNVVRAWEAKKPVIVAPAMNTAMWDHYLTFEHLHKISCMSGKFRKLMPVEKTLACGDVGVGAMASIESIVGAVISCVP